MFIWYWSPADGCAVRQNDEDNDFHATDTDRSQRGQNVGEKSFGDTLKDIPWSGVRVGCLDPQSIAQSSIP